MLNLTAVTTEWLCCRGVGATAVLLTPIVMTAVGDGPMGQAPMSFFAPNPALGVSSDPLSASQELKHVIKQLHLQGIEVILQVPRLLVLFCA